MIPFPPSSPLSTTMARLDELGISDDGLFRNRKFLVRPKEGKTKTTRGSRVIIDEGPLRRESRGGVRVESGVRAR